MAQIATIENNLLNFISVPHRLEPLLAFGFLVSVDCFLYVITFLPIKVAIAIAALCLTVLQRVTNNVVTCPPYLRFHRRNLYDLIRGILIVISCSVLQRFR